MCLLPICKVGLFLALKQLWSDVLLHATNVSYDIDLRVNWSRLTHLTESSLPFTEPQLLKYTTHTTHQNLRRST